MGCEIKKNIELRLLETGPLLTVVWEVEVMELVLELKLKLRISRPRLSLFFDKHSIVVVSF